MLYPLSTDLIKLTNINLSNLKQNLLTQTTIKYKNQEISLSFLTLLLFQIYKEINNLSYLTKNTREYLIKQLIKEIENNLDEFILAILTILSNQTLNLYFYSPFKLNEICGIIILPPFLFNNYKNTIIGKNLKEKLGKYPSNFVVIQLNLNNILLEILKENKNFKHLISNHKDLFDNKIENLPYNELLIKGIEKLQTQLEYSLDSITINTKNFKAILEGRDYNLNNYKKLDELLPFGGIGFKKHNGKKQYITIEDEIFLKEKPGKNKKD